MVANSRNGSIASTREDGVKGRNMCQRLGLLVELCDTCELIETQVFATEIGPKSRKTIAPSD